VLSRYLIGTEQFPFYVSASDSFQRLIERARSAYDHVIIDTPPVLIVPDASVVARMAHSVIYLVHWNGTKRTQFDEGIKRFRLINIQIIALVLSQIAPKLMRAYCYGGNYGP
jgi:Mrp family chromosome partitioning ATPase